MLDIDEKKARATADLIEGSSGAVHLCDVTRETDILQAMAAVRRDLGPVSILVNSAGVACAAGLPFTNNTEADWDRVLSVNVKGMFLMAKAASADMIARGDGRIVNVSSIVGIINAPFMPPYSVSKAAVNSLTKVMAKDLAPRGVTVNAVCPGFVWTDMWMDVGASMMQAGVAGQATAAREVFQSRIDTLVPMRREQTPEDVAELVCFLCSPAARNITGQIIAVDGGVTA